VRHRGRPLTHEALLRQVWGAAYAQDRQTLRAHMTNLRRKLGAPSATGVTPTYPGVGYLLEDHPTANCARPSVASAGSTPRPGVRAT
jgi:DNA-binding response OmpR family regulator